MKLQKKLKKTLLSIGLLTGFGLPLAWGQENLPTQIDISQSMIDSQQQSNLVARYQQLAKQKNLANHVVWQRLFYVNHQQVSDVTYQDFFLHPTGKTNLALELDETIAQLLTNKTEQSPRCRFPARSEWLIEQLQIQENELPTLNCQTFDDWFGKINPHTMTLVFASDYMGNPSSMFGHTLLRLDPPKIENKNMDLVAYALNYAAITPQNENSAMYAFKGLTGKYGGEYSLMRYFHKTKEYGDMESRDLWEYELDLTPKEVKFLVKHIWEMKHVHFPYYFMDKNCSYALMGLIDLVRPELSLQDKFSWTVIPIETVKAIQKANLIRDKRYRPALESHLKAQEKHYGKKFSQLANQLTQENIKPQQILENYNPTAQAGLLEMAYDNLYFGQASRTVNREFAQKRLRELLVLRSQLDVPKQRVEPTMPKYDPAQGHGAKSVGISLGQSQQQETANLHYRVAYHGLSDPQMGYHSGELLFLDGSLQIQKNKIKVDYLDVLSVKSVNPISSYKRPRSWGTQIGYHQIAVDKQGNFSETQTQGVGVLAGQMGYAKNLFNDNLQCAGYLRGELQIGKVFDNYLRLGFSPTVQCTLHTSEKWQSMLKINLPYWHDSQKLQTQIQGELQYQINPNRVVRLTATHEAEGNKNWQKMMLGYHHYY